MNPLEKHRPKTLEEYGPSLHTTTVVNYVKAVRKGAIVKPMCLLFGPPGCGKTTLVRCVAESLRLDLSDTNASDERSTSSVRAAANAAMNGTAVFLDEADSMGQKEQKLLAKLAPQFQAPVFLAANDESKLDRDLRNLCIEVEVPKPSKQKLREIGRKVKASPRTIVQATSFRDLVHDAGGSTTGEYTQSEILGALLGGDPEAGKVSDVMRAEPWILDNASGVKSPLSFDLWRSRYRRVGSSMEKYARRAAADARLERLRFPWSLAEKGRAKRKRLAAEAQEKAARKEEEVALKKEDREALRKAQEMASRPKVAAMEEWI